MHTDRLNALISEKVPRNLQNALAMLCCIAPFVPLLPPEHIRDASRPDTIVEFFSHSAPS
jgi:hypothetical protein